MTSGIRFNIYYTVEGSDDEFLYAFDTNAESGLDPNLLVLQATYLPDAVLYGVSLVLDGVSYPAQSFVSVPDMWSWISTNWGTLGSWFHIAAARKVVLYANKDSGSLTITSRMGVRALFPELGDGEYFIVTLDGHGSPTELLYTREAVLNWAQDNLGEGNWMVEGDYLVYLPDAYTGDEVLTIIAAGAGAFSVGFSNAFLN